MPSEWQDGALCLGFAILSGEAVLSLRSGQRELGPCSISYFSVSELVTIELQEAEALLWPLNPLWGIAPELELVQVLDEVSAGVLYDVFFKQARSVEHQHVALQLVGHQMAAGKLEPNLISPSEASFSSTVCSFMEDHLDEIMSLERLANQFNCGKQKIMRSFKVEQGLSPMKKLAQLRIDKVKLSLQRSDMNISQIAASVGYADLPSFSHFFKKNAGMSPSEYRSQIQWLV